jgi:hypothetical protein
VASGLVAAACGSGDDADDDTEPAAEDQRETVEGEADTKTAEVVLPPSYEGYESEQYGNDANWLCKPGIARDVCGRDLDATAVFADGTTEVQPHEPADDPAVDCFYVYPTVSSDQGANSDLRAAEGEEIFAVRNQAARLTGACRVFAPVYRQIPLSGIGGGGDDAPEGVDPGEVAYGDVLDAFRHYVANESDGRGFVLVGHSQGANHLRRLVAEEIDDEPLLRDRLVSARLLGWPVVVPEGDVVGGDFQNVPLCGSSEETGCIVSYSSFRSTSPPPDNSLFGRAGGPGGGDVAGRAACVNPASPEGGAAAVQPYFLVDAGEGGLVGGVTHPFADETRTSEITTPWITFPDLVEADCVEEGEFTYLELTVNGDPDDPRTDDIPGDLTPEWGMHLVDANVDMGDLVDLVATQAEAYTGDS